MTPAKIREVKTYVVRCGNCGEDIETKKTSGKIQCWSCKKRTDLD